MIGTGFMKCMPMTFAGRFVAAAIFVMEIDEVFDARMHSGRVMRSSCAKSCVFASSFSTIGVADGLDVGHGTDAADDRVALFRRHLPLVDAALQVAGDG
jgi:hypothetical protein